MKLGCELPLPLGRDPLPAQWLVKLVPWVIRNLCLVSNLSCLLSSNILLFVD